MVFGLGRKKKKNKIARITDIKGKDVVWRGQPDIASLQPPTPQPARTTIRLDDIPDVVSRLDDTKSRQTITAIRDLRNKVEPMIEELIRMVHTLEQDDLNVDSIDKHLAVIVVRGKKQVIDVVRRGVSPLPEINSLDDATRATTSLGQMLKKVGDVLGRQTKVIHIFAKKHASRFKDNLAIMNSHYSEMRVILDNQEHAKSESNEVLASLAKIKGHQETRDKNLQKISDLLTEGGMLKERISDIEDDTSAIKSSDEYRNHLRLQSKLEEFDVQKSQTADEINLQFAKITRPLSRYEYGSSLDKDQQRVLAALVADPGSTLSEENTDTVAIILENVRRGVESGAISVRDRTKMLSMLAETASCIGPLADKMSECSRRRAEVSAEADMARPVRLDELEREFVRATSAHQNNKSRGEALRAEVNEADSRIPIMIAGLETKLRQYTAISYDIVTD